MRVTHYFLLVIVCFQLSSASAQSPAPPYRTGPKFQQRLEEWISVTLQEDRNELRAFCRDLSESREISIVCDRRLDPHSRLEIRAPLSGSAREVVEQLAQSQQAVVTECGDALLLIPQEYDYRLKTLIALRTEEMRELIGSDSGSSTSQIERVAQRNQLTWKRLDRPRDLAQSLTAEQSLKLINPELIPHDLWSAGTLPSASFIEKLSWILFQYDLTFAWEKGNQVRIVPISNDPDLTRIYRLSTTAAKQLQTQIKKTLPAAPLSSDYWKQTSTRATVTGPWEIHQLIDQRNQQKSATVSRVPWRKQEYTMQVQRKSLEAVLTYLKQSGFPVQYDAEQLTAAGIDLQQLISFETNNATASELIKAICDPAGLKFSLTDEAIKIAPAAP